jgi:hypothetical protein
MKEESLSEKARKHLRRMLKHKTHIPLAVFVNRTGLEITPGHFSRCKKEVLREQNRYTFGMERAGQGWF